MNPEAALQPTTQSANLVTCTFTPCHIGFEVNALSEVVDVEADSQAEEAGIQKGWLLLHVTHEGAGVDQPGAKLVLSDVVTEQAGQQSTCTSFLAMCTVADSHRSLL